ncbi:NFATC2-interacting protein [Exaiptasia diaphana]|uniref:Ubiquitin-like domain-containing protein n=1 Tax=Exaiptasia diaphana TaxID=2652724 RepID=A0A913Y1T5_EXADI|nr:NFATC2-interacting protein [Exaiptasia diaphana]KXJ29198.1 NFATC2-interacting protein [Exaiptasia diaphana]
MASKAVTKTKNSKKQEIGKKRKLTTPEPDDFDLFAYKNQMPVTFGYSTKNTKIMVPIDSSDEEEEELDVDASEFARISSEDEEDENEDDSQELLHITDSEESVVETNNKSTTCRPARSPSPPPPPSQADMLRVQRQLRAKNKKARDFDAAYNILQQAVADSVSPLPTSSSRTEVINLDDSVSPLIVRNRNDRKMTVKVRTRSGIKRFDMKAGDKFETIIKELAESEKVSPENILLSLRSSNIMIDDTPLSKGVSVADIIECIIMESSPVVEEENLIEIKVQGNDAASRKTFHVSKTKPLESLFAEYAEFRKIKRSSLKFLFDDDPLEGTETPEDLDMEDENLIDVRVIS